MSVNACKYFDISKIYDLITRFYVITFAPLTELFCNCLKFCNSPLADL